MKPKTAIEVLVDSSYRTSTRIEHLRVRARELQEGLASVQREMEGLMAQLKDINWAVRILQRPIEDETTGP